MAQQKMGLLNKKEILKKIIMISIVIVIIISIVLIINGIKNNKGTVDIIKKEKKTAILYIWNSNKNECKNCKKIKTYLDEQKIKYTAIDVKGYSERKLNKMLKKLSINPPDFGYPAVLYISEGNLFSDAINLENVKVVDTFIKQYKLLDIK